MSFVGALNVGSIKLHFDQSLVSNLSQPQTPYITDKNYKHIFNAEDSNIFKIPELKN